MTIRRATAQDADRIGALAAEFQTHLRAMGSEADFDWGAAQYLRDGFGPDPAFEGIVAEIDATVVGYALYDRGYDTDRGQRYIYLIDLFVSGTHRGRGIGQALMDHLGAIGRGRGAELIAWSVLKGDAAVQRFYEKLGARYVDESRVMWCPI